MIIAWQCSKMIWLWPRSRKAFFRSLGGATVSLCWLSINSASSSEHILSSVMVYSRKQHGVQREVWRHGRSDERRNFFMRTCMAASGSPRLHVNADFLRVTLHVHSKHLSASPLTNG